MGDEKGAVSDVRVEAKIVVNPAALDNARMLSLSNTGAEIANKDGRMPTHAGLELGWEHHVWQPQTTASDMGRAAADRAQTPYRAAVPARIADMTVNLQPDVLSTAEDARAAITRFDAELSAMFNGEFTPLASVLLRTESASSSQIENITAGTRALALAELDLTTFGSNAKLIAANVAAMQRALDLADNVTPTTILAIHEVLMHGQEHADPGAFRTEQVWIGGDDSSPHNATFVPPHHERVPAAINDLCTFAARPDVPLLPQAAITHAQFETIHPFNDGNGRTGRALVHAMLKHGGATTRTTVPVSAGLLTNTRTYFAALTAYREGDPNPIVARFSEAAFTAINNGRHLANDLQTIHQDWHTKLTARRDSVAWRILPILLSQPAITSAFIQHRTNTSQPATDRALRQLREDGILKSKNEHGEDRKRDVVWRADDVLAALDAFGERTRRSRR